MSGGQKARVSLARAVYSGADLVIADDPLAAVDSHVADALFNKCFRGILSKTTRILITNQLQFLEGVDRIIVLEEGRVVDSGSYSELTHKHGPFAALLTRLGEELDSAEEDELSELSGVGVDDNVMAVDETELPLITEEDNALQSVMEGDDIPMERIRSSSLSATRTRSVSAASASRNRAVTAAAARARATSRNRSGSRARTRSRARSRLRRRTASKVCWQLVVRVIRGTRACSDVCIALSSFIQHTHTAQGVCSCRRRLG